jgi:uncharacterized protein
MRVVHEPDRKRFLVRLPEGEGELVYEMIDPATIDLRHTGVQPTLQGRGVGAELVSHAFRHARENGLRVVPTCPYVQRWLKDHPEAHDLLVRR